jgi:hypothetical protein
MWAIARSQGTAKGYADWGLVAGWQMNNGIAPSYTATVAVVAIEDE